MTGDLIVFATILGAQICSAFAAIFRADESQYVDEVEVSPEK